MTNPPFYDPSSMEISTARIGDGRSRTNMTVSEGNYPGGEVCFVTEMIEDSLRIATSTTDHHASYKMTTTGSSNCFTAAWYSSMLGKKTSLVKLQKLVVHLLGPAHVEAIEYGPGHYTRWFLAWTLEQPPATASGALLPHNNDKDNFQITMAIATTTPISSSSIDERGSIPIDTRNVAAVREVANRIVAFCDSSPGGWDLTTTTNNRGEEVMAIVRIVETMPPAVTHFVDETQNGVEIPESILQVLRGRDNSRFLPNEGHFLIEAKIQVANNINNMNNINSLENNHLTVQVHLACYRHSARGAKAIEKIRNSLGGEVCRTNRKWRKIRERQNHHQH